VSKVRGYDLRENIPPTRLGDEFNRAEVAQVLLPAARGRIGLRRSGGGR
jgi:hypothetical protein